MHIQTQPQFARLAPDYSAMAHDEARRKLRELAQYAAQMRYFS